MRYKVLCILLTIITVMSAPGVKAAENEAFTLFSTARNATHKAGPFRLRGDETSVAVTAVNGKTTSATKIFSIDGYDYNAAETYMKFSLKGKNGGEAAENAFLITPSRIYTKENAEDWAERDILTLLPEFLTLGTFDQFIMLELLNSNRVALYSEFMTQEPEKSADGVTYDVVRIKTDREGFKKLVGLLTEDVTSLLGDAAQNMSASRLSLVKTFAEGMLLALDAEMIFTAYIDKETGLITRFNTQMDMANPYGTLEPGSVSRIKTSSRLTFYDFGQKITKIVVD